MISFPFGYVAVGGIAHGVDVARVVERVSLGVAALVSALLCQFSHGRFCTHARRFGESGSAGLLRRQRRVVNSVTSMFQECKRVGGWRDGVRAKPGSSVTESTK